MKSKLIKISTVPLSLNFLLKGQLDFLNNHYYVIGVSCGGEDLELVKNREGVTVFPIQIERKISLFKDLLSLIQLYKFLKIEKPVIVHSITPKAGLLSMVAAKIAKVPVRIHTFTGLIFPSKKGIMRNILIGMDRLLCYCATNIYPEGEGIKKDLITYKITGKPLKIIANGNVNGIDITFFSSTQISKEQKRQVKGALEIDSENFVFVFVGRLVKDKGINELVNAFVKLQAKHSGVKLLLVGAYEKDLDPLLRETEEEIEQNDEIIAVGFQHDVRPYLAIADALAFPSYREGFPNVVMQAGAMGLPSIVTDINGCNEIIQEGKNGTIIPVKRIDALYAAMEKMLTDLNYRNQLAANARQMIVNRYEQQMVWNALLAEYKRLEQQYV